MTEKNYYLLEVDDAVIALENKDVQIKSLEDENAELSHQILCLKDEVSVSKNREEIAIACLCRLREQGNEDAIKTLEELLVR